MTQKIINYEINQSELKMFWDFYFYNLNKNDLIEIRLVGVKNNNVFNLFKNFCSLNNIYQKKNCQMFLNSSEFEILRNMMLYKDSFIPKNCKICYSINPRFFTKNEKSQKVCSGGYNNIRKVHIIAFDIEKTTHSNLSDFEEKQLKKYITNLEKSFEYYNLFKPFIIMSGAGIHFLYKIKPQLITNGKKLWFKNWIDDITLLYKTEMFHFDPLKDFTRIFGLPESINLKRIKKVKIIQPSTHLNDKFKIKSRKISKKTIKSSTKIKYIITSELSKEPLVDFLLNYRHDSLQYGSELSRNAYLELQFACLLRDNGIAVGDIKNIINNINLNLNKVVQVDPKRVPANYNFSKKVVNKWTRVCCGFNLYK